MATSQARPRPEPPIKAKPRCGPYEEINILLLGQRGVGKSTFINAFANHLVYDTLDQAVDGEMQAVIASYFDYTDLEKYDMKAIVIGKEDKYEQFKNGGQSNTQLCRSFVFPIGNRNLRFIDTPGVGDTRESVQDDKNFHQILTYIAQYEHLNAVVILLKPNEERLNVLFRYSVDGLLRRLNVGVKENIVFVFTNARSTSFLPGSSVKPLRELLNKLRTENNIDVPFNRRNAFLFDNEAFRYLALCKNGIRVNNEAENGSTTSWDHSVKEYARLMEHINQLPLHAVSNTLSLNEAEQLVRKLPRPIAETARLIEENIQLAKEHNKKVLEDPQIASQRIPQKCLEIQRLKYPRTVCTADKCCQVTGEGLHRKVEYLSICHERCYLNGVQQETLADPNIRECEVMDPRKDFCTVCKCCWRQHKHITYECDVRLTYEGSNDRSSTTTNKEVSLSEIDRRITDLKNEKHQIEEVYKKLARFLHGNAIIPINDDFLDYLQYFIREEQMKQNSGADNRKLIDSLEQIVADYKNEMEFFKRTRQDQRDTHAEIEVIQPEEVFTLVATLYRLPITGKQIRAQVECINISQKKYSAQHEVYVELPAKAASSHVMCQLEDILSGRRRN